MKNLRIAMLAAAVAEAAFLRVPTAMSEVKVDREAGIIRNVRVMTAGEASGHPFSLDQTSLAQAHALLAAESDGMKMHFKHPDRKQDGSLEDQAGAIVGRLKNCRLEGDRIIGDVHLGKYAKALPGLGDVWTYLMDIAEDDPSAIGLSTVFSWRPEVLLDSSGRPTGVAARISVMHQVDFVGDPAANPNGLLSARRDAPAETPVVRMMNQILRGEKVS